jgi:hypothetical protein
MPYADIEVRREFERTYWKDHKEESAEKKQNWRTSAPVVERNKKWKIEVLTHYGNGVLACVKCGFTDIRALTIDHINNDGYAHRKTLGLSGRGFYYWLKRENFPEGFQTLCMNCQFIKREETGTGNALGRIDAQ